MRTPRTCLLGAIGLFVLLRCSLFPLGQNYLADAVARTELAQRWAAHPHFISNPEEVYVIGPLHAYLAGAGVLLFPADPDLGSRLPSLLLGCLAVVPLIRLGRRTGAPLGPALAVASVALYTLHLQASLAAHSEAVFLTFLLLAFDHALALGDSGAARHALAGGGTLLLATATRYDGWIYAPLLCLAVLFALRAGRVSPGAALIFFALAAAFPLFWTVQSARLLGDPFWAFATTQAYHRDFVRLLVHERGPTLYRLHALFYWPINLLATLSPGVFFLGLLGAARAFAAPGPQARWARTLLLCAALPPALLTFRAAVLLDFGLIARFTTVAGAVLAVFVGRGVQDLRERAVPAKRITAALLPAALLPLLYVACSHGRSDLLAEQVRSISPLPDLPPAVAQAARALRDRPPPPPLLIDHRGFAGMTTAHYARLPEASLLRVSWQGWEADLARRPPACALLFAGGQLGSALGIGHPVSQTPRVELRGRRLRLTATFPHTARRLGPHEIEAGLYCDPALK